MAWQDAIATLTIEISLNALLSNCNPKAIYFLRQSPFYKMMTNNYTNIDLLYLICNTMKFKSALLTRNYNLAENLK